MASLIITIISAVIAATMSGIGIWQAQKANEANQQLAIENREDQQAFATQAAKEANKETEHRYWNLYSPSSTVNQLKAAGLSPGLFYGQGGSSGSNQQASMATTPSSMPAMVNPIIPGDIFTQMFKPQESYYQSKKTNSEAEVNETRVEEIKKNIERMDTEIDEIETRCGVNIATKEFVEMQAQREQIKLKYDKETYEDMVNSVHQQYEYLVDMRQKVSEEIKALEISNYYKDRYEAKTLEKIDAEIDLLIAEKGKKLAETTLANAKEALTNAQKDLTETQKTKLEKDSQELEYMLEDMEKLGWKATKSDNIYSEFIGVAARIFELITGKKVEPGGKFRGFGKKGHNGDHPFRKGKGGGGTW